MPSMHPLQHLAAAAVALLCFGLALSLILDATRKKPRNTFLDEAGGPWAWVGAFTICGAMGAAKALGA